MRSSAGGLLALVMLAVLTACGSTGPQPGSGGTGTLSGIVRAPAGGDVQGTLVEACFVTGTQCDDASPQTRSVTIQQAGASAPYSISGLADGMYGLFACRDMNGNNQGYQCDDGDFFGFYTTDGQNPQGVEPPDAGLDIQMFVLGTGGGGTSSAGLPPDDGHTTSSFRQSDVAVDDSGITHLLYAGSSADGASSPVRYGECSAQCLSPGSWRFVTLGDFGSPGLGGGARLALDADGHPRVLWYQQASVNGDGAYVYGACDGGCTTTSNWSVQPVVMVPGGMASALTNASFVLDGQGRPRFVFMDLLNGVTYAWCDSGCTDGTNWQLARPTPTATGSELSSTLDLAFDAGGRLHAAYEGIALDN
ncbi:MAG TPA: hypothetical protein VF171_08515, partial [Trueperaceae bacterium]